jgi:hypothetical protein
LIALFNPKEFCIGSNEFFPTPDEANVNEKGAAVGPIELMNLLAILK